MSKLYQCDCCERVAYTPKTLLLGRESAMGNDSHFDVAWRDLCEDCAAAALEVLRQLRERRREATDE